MRAMVATLLRAGFDSCCALRRAGAIAVVIGVPTVLIENSFFRRMTHAWVARRRLGGRCPSCGHGPSGTPAFPAPTAGWSVSGALNYFVPVQPQLAVLSIGVLIVTLRGFFEAATRDVSNGADKSQLTTTPDAMEVAGLRRFLDERKAVGFENPLRPL